MSGRHDVVAVVTTFRPEPSILPNLHRIAAQVDKVILVDDSGNGGGRSSMNFSDIGNIVVVVNEVNIGIAASLNRGIRQAAQLNYRWVITLDDDTLVSMSYVSDVLEVAESGRVPALGLIACSRGNDERGKSEKTGSPDSGSFKLKRTLITSGCLLETRIFEEIRGFDESLFIDLVDFDFCTRLRKAGRKLVLLEKVGMAHKVGHGRSVRFLGRDIVIYNHAPFRLYYQIRNTFLFARKHFAFDPLLCSYLLLDIVRLPIKVLLFESRKKTRLHYLAAGFLDGLRGQGGRIRIP